MKQTHIWSGPNGVIAHSYKVNDSVFIAMAIDSTEFKAENMRTKLNVS